MRITADTNVLIRALVQDDPDQAAGAAAVLEQAELIAVPLTVLCELVWVLRRVYRFSPNDCCEAIETLMQSRTVVVDRPAVELGLRLLAAGGDFADGVIALSGSRLGAEALVTFDQQAASLLQDCGQAAHVL